MHGYTHNHGCISHPILSWDKPCLKFFAFLLLENLLIIVTAWSVCNWERKKKETVKKRKPSSCLGNQSFPHCNNSQVKRLSWSWWKIRIFAKVPWWQRKWILILSPKHKLEPAKYKREQIYLIIWLFFTFHFSNDGAVSRDSVNILYCPIQEPQ